MYNLYRLAAARLIAGKSTESDEVLVIDSADVTLSRKDSARLRVREFDVRVREFNVRVREFNEPFDISNSDSHSNFSNKQANALAVPYCFARNG